MSTRWTTVRAAQASSPLTTRRACLGQLVAAVQAEPRLSGQFGAEDCEGASAGHAAVRRLGFRTGSLDSPWKVVLVLPLAKEHGGR